MSDMQNFIEELKVFGMYPDNKVVIARCLKLCKIHKLSIESIVEELMGIVLDKANVDSREETTVVTSEMINKLEAIGFKKPEKKVVVDVPVKALEPPSPKVVEQREKCTQMFSPTTFLSGTPSVKYGGRMNKGNVVVTFNCDNNDPWSPFIEEKSPPVIKQVNHDALTKHVPFMYETLRDKISVLDSHSIILGELVDLPLDDGNDERMVLGRIVSSDETKLGPMTTMLERTIKDSQGHVAHLDLTKLESPASLFPGQIVQVEAHDTPGKDRIVAKNIFSRASLPSLPPVDHSIPLRVVVASGPFSTYDSLTYEPLMDLLKEVNKCKPNVLILIGPFIDESHPLIGQMDETFDSVFNRLLQDISKTVEDITVIIQTCVRDAHQLPVYPTPPPHLHSKLTNFHIIPDPCLIAINDIVFGITATDVLFHLSKQEFASSQHPSDRFSRLASHILSQQTFYPLFPPAEDHPLDSVMWEEHCQISVKPNVLILPSDLRCFVKNVDDCVVVNPEHLCKEAGGGLYAKIDIVPSQGKLLLPDNVKVAVVKI